MIPHKGGMENADFADTIAPARVGVSSASVRQVQTLAAAHAKRRDAARARFLETFAACGNVTVAAQAAGAGRSTVYAWLVEDPEYRLAFNEAREMAADALEAEAHRRAVKGYERPVYHNGALVGTVTEYSDRLLEVLLRANRPERFRERAGVEVTLGALPGFPELPSAQTSGRDGLRDLSSDALERQMYELYVSEMNLDIDAFEGTATLLRAVLERYDELLEERSKG